MDRTLYDILDTPPGTAAEDLRRAYHLLVLRCHPDISPAASREAATERMKEINAAFHVLSNSQQRAEYDRLLSYARARVAARSPFEALDTQDFTYVQPMVFAHASSADAEATDGQECVAAPCPKQWPSRPIRPARQRERTERSRVPFLFLVGVLVLYTGLLFTYQGMAGEPVFDPDVSKPLAIAAGGLILILVTALLARR